MNRCTKHGAERAAPSDPWRLTPRFMSVLNQRMGRATINDVARHSGVSVATVSRAIRGLPNVSPATRRKVLESASELRYQPNANAAGLVL